MSSAVGDRPRPPTSTQLDGVEVGEPAVEAGGDVVAAVGLDRATGQQGAQPRRSRSAPRPAAAGRGGRRSRRRRPRSGWCCMTVLFSSPAGAGERVQVAERGASARSRGVRRRRRRSGVDLRRRRNGMPIRYRPGAAVTPPSCTTRPLRSNTGDVQEGQVRPVAGGPDDRSRSRRDRGRADSGGGRGHRGRREPLRRLGRRRPARSAQASMVSSSLPSLRSASAHTFGSDPENCAVPSRTPASRPTSRTPSAAQRVQVERRPLRRADQLHRRQVARPEQVRDLRPSARRAGPTRPSTTGCRGPGRSAASARARRRPG